MASSATSNGVSTSSTLAAPHLHDDLASASTPHFASLDWRLDVATQSRHGSQGAEPTAIVQINTKSRVVVTPSVSAPRDQQFQFELDRKTAAQVLQQMEKIDAIMSQAAQ